MRWSQRSSGLCAGTGWFGDSCPQCQNHAVNLNSIKNFFSDLNFHHVPTGAAVLVGLVLLVLVFKAGKFLAKLFFFLVALALFAGAYWWHTHK
jgi:hypothetical protein